MRKSFFALAFALARAPAQRMHGAPKPFSNRGSGSAAFEDAGKATLVLSVSRTF